MKEIIVLLLMLMVAITLLTGCTKQPKETVPPAQTAAAGSTTNIPGDVAAGGIDDMPVEEIEINFTADEARAILQAWVDSHPFHMGAVIASDESLMPGQKQGEDWDERMYTFYLGITRLGVAEILVHKETGALYHSDSPYSSVGFTAIDNWYNKDHAEYAAALSANDARAIYNTWLGSHAGMSQHTLGQQYEIYQDGAYYYLFHAENAEWYWFNILVDMQSGELLFMMAPDGEDPTMVIESLDVYYDRYY